MAHDVSARDWQLKKNGGQWLLGKTFDNARATVLAKSLDQANGAFLDSDKSPKRKAGELDNRGSHFYLALYWAQALAEQDDDGELKALFAKLTEVLKAQEQTIIDELNGVQGKPVDIQGYFHPDYQLTREAMRPSATFNKALEEIVKN